MKREGTRVLNGAIHFDGYPDAVKLISVTGQKARQLADLTLHNSDLEFAESCLKAAGIQSEVLVRDGLWIAAVFTFMKCFKSAESRSKLDEVKIFGGRDGALEAFIHTKELRDRHLAHDVNAMSQCVVGAVLAPRGMTPKVLNVISSEILQVTHTKGARNNLLLLIGIAKSHVETRYDELAASIAAELERKDYDVLLATKALSVRAGGKHTRHPRRR